MEFVVKKTFELSAEDKIMITDLFESIFEKNGHGKYILINLLIIV